MNRVQMMAGSGNIPQDESRRGWIAEPGDARASPKEVEGDEKIS